MAIFRRLVVLLDDRVPKNGAFALAADWAWRLQLPILGVSLPDGRSGSNGCASPKTAEIEKQCADFCARRNIPWQVSRWQEPLAAELRRLIQPTDLLVGGPGLPPALRHELFREAKAGIVPALLLCPQIYQPLTRILFLDQSDREDDDLLIATVEFCRDFQAGLVVLTVARTEDEARRRQQRLRQVLQGLKVMTDFDFLVGGEVRGAAASVARWRHCQLVVMAPLESPRWWRWWRADSRSWSMDLVDSLAFLTLTGAGNSMSSREVTEAAPVHKALSRGPLVPSG